MSKVGLARNFPGRRLDCNVGCMPWPATDVDSVPKRGVPSWGSAFPERFVVPSWGSAFPEMFVVPSWGSAFPEGFVVPSFERARSETASDLELLLARAATQPETSMPISPSLPTISAAPAREGCIWTPRRHGPHREPSLSTAPVCRRPLHTGVENESIARYASGSASDFRRASTGSGPPSTDGSRNARRSPARPSGAPGRRHIRESAA